MMIDRFKTEGITINNKYNQLNQQYGHYYDDST